MNYKNTVAKERIAERYKIMNYKNTVAKERMAERLMEYTLISSLPVSYGVKRRLAFTLGDFLIVLAIIGVVAAMVIPGIKQYTQDLEFKDMWKKTYATLSEATKKLYNDTGNLELGT